MWARTSEFFLTKGLHISFSSPKCLMQIYIHMSNFGPAYSLNCLIEEKKKRNLHKLGGKSHIWAGWCYAVSAILTCRKCHTASLLLQQNKHYVDVMCVLQITLQNWQTKPGWFKLFTYLFLSPWISPKPMLRLRWRAFMCSNDIKLQSYMFSATFCG